MGSGTKRLDRDTRRDQIARAALSIVGDKGVKGLTTAALAKEVGISEANLYRHFENKDEILLEAVVKIGEGLKHNLGKMFGDPVPPQESLKKLFMLHLDYIEKNRGIPRLIFSNEIHVDNDRLREGLLTTINAYSGRLETLFSAWQKAGVIKSGADPKATALTLLGMIQAITIKWSLSNFSFSLIDEGLKLWTNFERCMAE